MRFGQPGVALKPVKLAGEGGAAPIRAPHMAVDDFLPARFAEQLRQPIDDHFAEPMLHRPDSHQVWNYWYVPDLYTYLRTQPEKIIPRPLIERFRDALSKWAGETLGLASVTWPYLSLYVDGCQQSLHNDSANGRFGYVYSLTWDDRKTIGGETIVLREGDLFRSNLSRSAAGWGLYDLISPRFNRLAIFDDRMPHGVQRVEGSMDPLEGRFVLHGHISEGGPVVDGPLAPATIAEALEGSLAETLASLAGGEPACHGPLALRLVIAPSGEVLDARPLLDRVARLDGEPTAHAVGQILLAASATKFPPPGIETRVNVPVIIGGALPRTS